MHSPILRELVAREQDKDRLREAEHFRLVEAAMARRPAHRFNLRMYVGDLLIAVRHIFKAPARRLE